MKKKFKGSTLLNPVPVVLITSRNKEGKDNVFTVAWTGTICTRPPMLSISIRPERLSYDYIKETMEFVVNLPTKDMVKKVDYCGVRSGRKHDKISEMHFTLKESSNVNVGYIEECPINITCKVTEIIELGSHHLFLASVESTLVDEKIIDEKGKICFEKADLMAYCHGEYFPINKYPIGKFGFSVARKKAKKRNFTTKRKK